MRAPEINVVALSEAVQVSRHLAISDGPDVEVECAAGGTVIGRHGRRQRCVVTCNLNFWLLDLHRPEGMAPAIRARNEIGRIRTWGVRDDGEDEGGGGHGRSRGDGVRSKGIGVEGAILLGGR